jgi:hypothetical protein
MFSFCYRNPLTGKWVNARYLAERHEIAASFAGWEIIGLAEIRTGGDWGAGFNPMRGSTQRPPK